MAVKWADVHLLHLTSWTRISLREPELLHREKSHMFRELEEGESDLESRGEFDSVQNWPLFFIMITLFNDTTSWVGSLLFLWCPVVDPLPWQQVLSLQILFKHIVKVPMHPYIFNKTIIYNKSTIATNAIKVQKN